MCGFVSSIESLLCLIFCFFVFGFYNLYGMKLLYYTGRIDAFLKRAHKSGFSKELLTVNELLVESGRVMFKKIKSPTHCLHMLLPLNKKIGLQP